MNIINAKNKLRPESIQHLYHMTITLTQLLLSEGGTVNDDVIAKALSVISYAHGDSDFPPDYIFEQKERRIIGEAEVEEDTDLYYSKTNTH